MSTIQSPYRKQGSKRNNGCTSCIIKPNHVVRSVGILIAVWSCTLMLQEGPHAAMQRQMDTTNLHLYETSSSHIEPTGRRLGILVGIFTTDDIKNDREYRSRHRKLFTLWNDPRVCNLVDFQKSTAAKRALCEVVYTFVVGASGNVNAPTEWMPQDETDNGKRPTNPILLPSTAPFNHSSPDLSKNDVTRLNIR
jgi:hypothetical protein